MTITKCWLEEWGIPLDVWQKYNEYLNRHIEAVQEAGRKLGVDESQLATHDASKWDYEEFYGYAMHFFGGGAPNNFAHAWLHHIHHNPHHWEHWIFPNGFKGLENGCLEMPQQYILEMVADWQGAGYAMKGSWDISDWLVKNWDKIKLHPDSRLYLAEVLDGLGYKIMIPREAGS